MIDPELLELLESTVMIAAPQGQRSLDGAREAGTGAPYRAHVEFRRDMVRNVSGEEVMTSGRALLDGAYPALTEAHRITLPDGRTPTIVAIETSYDSAGPYQTTVYW